jgi:hypothetical protein
MPNVIDAMVKTEAKQLTAAQAFEDLKKIEDSAIQVMLRIRKMTDTESIESTRKVRSY